jgi:hypothetical protein
MAQFETQFQKDLFGTVCELVQILGDIGSIRVPGKRCLRTYQDMGNVVMALDKLGVMCMAPNQREWKNLLETYNNSGKKHSIPHGCVVRNHQRILSELVGQVALGSMEKLGICPPDDENMMECYETLCKKYLEGYGVKIDDLASDRELLERIMAPHL